MVSCVDIVLRGVTREKRHLRECLTLVPYTLPYLLTGHGLLRPKRIVTSPKRLPQIRLDREYLRVFLAQAPRLHYERLLYSQVQANQVNS